MPDFPIAPATGGGGEPYTGLQPLLLPPAIDVADLDVTQWGATDGAGTKAAVGSGASAGVRVMAAEDATDAVFARIPVPAGEWTVGAVFVIQPKDDEGASPALTDDAADTIDASAALVLVEDADGVTPATNARPYWGGGVVDVDQPDDLRIEDLSSTGFGSWATAPSNSSGTAAVNQAVEVLYLMMRRYDAGGGAWRLQMAYSLTGYAYKPLVQHSDAALTGEAGWVGLRLKSARTYVDVLRLGIIDVDDADSPWIRG